jgi:hypothetical protein
MAGMVLSFGLVFGFDGFGKKVVSGDVGWKNYELRIGWRRFLRGGRGAARWRGLRALRVRFQAAKRRPWLRSAAASWLGNGRAPRARKSVLHG